MPYFEFTTDDGEKHSGIICGRGLRSCYRCNRLSRWQCDYIIARSPLRRCDRHICERHRTNLAPDKDACPEHAPICLAAIVRRKAAGHA